MQEVMRELQIDCEAERERIVEFIRRTVKRLHKEGAVVGLSGGLDSSVCAYLLVEALGAEKVLGVFLPERDSASVHREHAQQVADTLGVSTASVDMTATLEEVGVYAVGPKAIERQSDVDAIQRRLRMMRGILGKYFLGERLAGHWGGETGTAWAVLTKLNKKEMHGGDAFGYTKVRMRMVYLAFFAWQHGYALTSTTDRSEYSIGLYDPHGDGVGDLTLLRHLYKTQIRQLAEHVGVPERITGKPHSGDLYGNIPHESALGITYEQLDMLLWAIDRALPDRQIAEIAPPGAVAEIRKCLEVASLIRSLPLALEPPAPTAAVRLTA